ncbi:histidine decarboxylase [Chitinophaga caeni]|uniref:Histidine decarboxylase n=1 Tax=Chitinophaga caeni TaxID=2029983 RepID=A0A291QXC1_9BACT|nr:histidine decarboxylase [Chitinophaga caeni]ATL48577.1 histidine decarboxylase [Chitinophaga caeni]
MLTVDKSIHERLAELLEEIGDSTRDFLGYPVSKDFNYNDLYPFFNYPLNNLGDPFSDSTYRVGTRKIEQEVVAFFAKLFRAPFNNWWGYVTNGGSEGNLYALYLARELYPNAMVYFSESTHYSVQKNLQLLGMQYITIRSKENGEMDYDDLEHTIQLHRQHPVIILANIGTTMTEARDHVPSIKQILKKLAIRQHYIHADAALSGSYIAFLQPKPAFDFEDGIDSIAISGHKFIGSPVPCGVVVVKKSNRDRIARSVSYIGSMDTTITGSRNGHSPLFLWYAIQKLGEEGFRDRAFHSLKVADYTREQLNLSGIPAWSNPQCITVVFPEVSKVISEKYQLASESGMTHIICMPNVSLQQVDQFIAEIKSEMVTV